MGSFHSFLLHQSRTRSIKEKAALHRECRLNRLFTCIAAFAAVAITGAGAAAAAAAAHCAPLLGFVNIADGQAQDQANHHNDNNIFHNFAFLNYFAAFRAFSAASFFPVLWIRYAMIAANTATAIRPPRKPAPKEPVVIRVPIW